MRSEIITKENFIEGKAVDIEDAIESVLDFMRENYVEWSNWSSNYKPNAHSENMNVKNEMIHNYCNGLRVEEGRKYYKLIGSNGGGTLYGRADCGTRPARYSALRLF